MERSLVSLLNQKPRNEDNLHLIAISNVKNNHNRFQRWWRKKYKTPNKPFEEHTHEELLIEMLEDFYEAHPLEADRMLAGIDSSLEAWDGQMPDDYEASIQKKLKKFFKRNEVDLSKYRSDETLNEEEEKNLLENLGRSLPKSKLIRNLGGKEVEDEFEDTFGD